jgi:hypothetical protein
MQKLVCRASGISQGHHSHAGGLEMSATKYTPGPWKIDEATDLPLAVIRDDEMGEGIVEFSACTPENVANARLIASAPDLLDELYRLLPFIEDAEKDPAYKPGIVHERTKAIRALIARAEGSK